MATTKNITMKQFNGTDYDTLYPKTNVEQVENLTPSSIGAVSKSGDTMTGPLTISKSDYSDLNLKNTGSGSTTKIRNSAHRTQIMSQEDENNYRSLTLNDKRVTTDVGSILQIQQIDGGVQTAAYKVLHTGNLSNLGVASIATGSYVGTGTHGESNPTILSAGFPPKALFIVREGYEIFCSQYEWEESGIWIQGAIGFTQSRNTPATVVTANGNTLSMYSTTSAYDQLNVSGETYHYVILG